MYIDLAVTYITMATTRETRYAVTHPSYETRMAPLNAPRSTSAACSNPA